MNEQRKDSEISSLQKSAESFTTSNTQIRFALLLLCDSYINNHIHPSCDTNHVILIEILLYLYLYISDKNFNF